MFIVTTIFKNRAKTKKEKGSAKRCLFVEEPPREHNANSSYNRREHTYKGKVQRQRSETVAKYHQSSDGINRVGNGVYTCYDL